MSELNQQLHDYVEGGLTPVDVHEIVRRASGRHRVQSPHPRRLPGLAIGSVAVVAAVALILGLVGRPSSSRTAVRAPAWTLASSTGPEVGFQQVGTTSAEADRLTCPTASVCYLETARNAAYRSVDRGRTWSQLPLPTGIAVDTAFTCLSADDCRFAGGSMATKFINGFFPGRSTPDQLFTTTDGGLTWNSQPIVIPPVTGSDQVLDSDIAGTYGFINQLDCFEADHCIAFGTTPTAIDEQPTGLSPQNSVSQTVVARTADGGRTWDVQDLPWSPRPDGGPAWSTAQPATFSCASELRCIGLASVIGQPNDSRTVGVYGSQSASLLEWSTADGGVTWSKQWLPDIQGSVSALQCPDPARCVATLLPGALGGGQQQMATILQTSDGGVHWQLHGLQPGGVWSQLGSLDCPSTALCVAGGSLMDSTQETSRVGLIMESRDGGVTWQQAGVPAPVAQVGSTSCTQAGECVAIAQGFTPDGVTQPQRPSMVLWNHG